MGEPMNSVVAATFVGSCAAEFGTPDRVEYHLDNWRRSHLAYEEVRGFPSKTLGTVNWSVKSDNEGMINRCDAHAAAVMEVIVNEDLPPAECCAIHHRYLHAVFRYPRANYVKLLEQAKLRIGLALSRKCIY